MAFALAGFSSGGANSKPGVAPGLFTYKTADALTAVRAAGYFNTVRDQLNVGDRIYVAVVDGTGALTAAGDLIVNQRTSTTVDTTDATALTTTDTD